MICAAFVSFMLHGAVQDGSWEKLSDPPKDVVGRESCSGGDGAWVYVPEWKGFLLYGGCTPGYTNDGWFFNPDKKEWTLLWADDALAYDKAKKQWQVLFPRDIVWTTDRPAAARGYGAVHDG